MYGRLSHKIAFFGLLALLFAGPVLLLLFPQKAAGTDALMQRLPAFSRFRCLNCHTSAVPTPTTAGLNVFGADFESNGNVWNDTLAVLNSDGDRCTNGFELGDLAGDGEYDHGDTPVENSNPGDSSDCSIALHESTWGVIKEIFGRELQEFFGEETDEEDLREQWGYFP